MSPSRDAPAPNRRNPQPAPAPATEPSPPAASKPLTPRRHRRPPAAPTPAMSDPLTPRHAPPSHVAKPRRPRAEQAQPATSARSRHRTVPAGRVQTSDTAPPPKTTGRAHAGHVRSSDTKTGPAQTCRQAKTPPRRTGATRNQRPLPPPNRPRRAASKPLTPRRHRRPPAAPTPAMSDPLTPRHAPPSHVAKPRRPRAEQAQPATSARSRHRTVPAGRVQTSDTAGTAGDGAAPEARPAAQRAAATDVS